MKQHSTKRARPWGQKRSKQEKLERKNKRLAREESAPYVSNWDGLRKCWVDNPRGLVRNTRKDKNRPKQPKPLYDFMCSAGSTRYAVYATSFGNAADQLLSKLIGKLKWLKRRPESDAMGGWEGVSISCLSRVKPRILQMLGDMQGAQSWVEHDYSDQAA